jgi:soluble lytic murein transglycosylase
MAEALHAAGDPLSAATAYQRVYYEYPLAEQADQAERALERLRAELGEKYPPATAQFLLGRANKLVAARLYPQARLEFEAAAAKLGGADRDLARVRVGVCSFLARDTGAAQIYLRSLEIATPQADAERMQYLEACARRMNDDVDVKRWLVELRDHYPQSTSRLEALIDAGNAHWVENQPARAVAFYRECFEAFPGQPQAAPCHWRVAFNAYMERRADARDLLGDHLRMFPASEQANVALYLLGRLEDSARNAAGAKGYYEEVNNRYPNSFYAVLARQRLGEPHIRTAVAAAPEFLAKVVFPPRRRQDDFQVNAPTKSRIGRGQLLSKMGFDDLAEAELKFGAKLGEQANLLAMELARVCTKKGVPDQGVRYMKSLAPGYLWLDFNSAPRSFWEATFPIPYRTALEKWAHEYQLDPFLVAGLIRQESEFNAKAVSRAKAYGLMQVLPRTGRSLAAKAGIKRFTTSMLFQPDVNMHLGCMYFKNLLGQHGGEAERALASYNAGKSRTDAWSTWTAFREPAEFIETVPFTETRNYIQNVLRNADMYRRLYAGTKGPAPAPTPASTPRRKSKR